MVKEYEYFNGLKSFGLGVTFGVMLTYVVNIIIFVILFEGG